MRAQGKRKTSEGYRHAKVIDVHSILCFTFALGGLSVISRIERQNSMIGSIIADSAKLSVGYVEHLLKDVTPAQFGRFAVAGGQTIESNHPAFILGHLNLYPSRVVSELGGDDSAIAPSSEEEALFSPAAKCVDDPDGSLYPAMDELVSTFTARHQAAIEALLASGDELFAAETPDERLRMKFATVGSLHAFYMGGHMLLHIGQFSAWRRAMGLGSP